MADRRRGRPDGRALAEQALRGDRRAAARILTLVENGHPEGQMALAQLFPRSGHAHVIGFTGSTGAGKSTLVNRVAQVYREQEVELAVVAVDPTSPFSGGALLGDRLRMRDLASDPGVFIRSMASRGHPGGVAHATRDLVTVLDALGVPVILVETVGAGQAQVDVARVAHTVVLVEAPGMGDDVQALKAGLLEIADVIVVNKADRPEAQQTLRTLRSARIGAQPESEGDEAMAWSVPILETSALEGKGVAGLVDTIQAHLDYLKASSRWEALRIRHARAEVDAWLRRHMQALLSEYVESEEIEEAVEAAASHERDPATVAKMLIDVLLTRLRG